MLTTVIILHALIAVAYFMLAFVIGTEVRLHTHRETVLARIGAGLFFLGCGLHHIGFAIHAIDGTSIPYTAWHHVIPAMMQVIGAPLFLLTTLPYAPNMLEVLKSDANSRS